MRLFLFCLFSCLSLAASAAPPSRYAQCTALASSAPQKALVSAREWLRTVPGNASAAHCEAMALYTLKDYATAETKLAALATREKPGDPRAAIRLNDQASQAASLAGAPGRAVNYLTDAIGIAQQRDLSTLLPNLLAHRADLWLTLKTPYKTLQDTEHGLSLDPDNKELLALQKQARASLAPPRVMVVRKPPVKPPAKKKKRAAR